MNARTCGYAAWVGFVGSVWLANWLLDRFGVIDLGFGLEGPAGLLAAGLAFGLRDVVHLALGRWWAVAGIITGSALALLVGAAARIPGGLVPIAVASATAFLLSELADLVVFARLCERWPRAVAVSNVVGSVIDSAVFLWLAFGGLGHMAGQVAGKWYMVLPSLPLVWAARRALSSDRLRPAGA